MTGNKLEVKRDNKGRFLKGTASIAPGRPPGMRQKLSASFLQDLAVHWQKEGGDILARVTKEEPATVLRVIASLVPRELALKLEAGAEGDAGITINLIGLTRPGQDPEPLEKDITPDTLRDIESHDE